MLLNLQAGQYSLQTHVALFKIGHSGHNLLIGHGIAGLLQLLGQGGQLVGVGGTMYTYRLLEYPSPPEQGDVYACLYVYRGTVIGGDVHTASMMGFMHGLKR